MKGRLSDQPTRRVPMTVKSGPVDLFQWLAGEVVPGRCRFCLSWQARVSCVPIERNGRKGPHDLARHRIDAP